jgi:hypothetical protein
MAAKTDKHAPVVVAEETPDGWADEVIVASVGIGEKPAAAQSVGQAEDAGTVQAEELVEIPYGNGVFGLGYSFENSEAAIETLHRGSFGGGRLHSGLEH